MIKSNKHHLYRKIKVIYNLKLEKSRLNLTMTVKLISKLNFGGSCKVHNHKTIFKNLH